MAAASASLSTFSSLSLHTTPSRFSPFQSQSFFLPKPIHLSKLKPITANSTTVETTFFDNTDPEEISTFDPPERPEDFIEPPSFDDGPLESEDDIAKAYEELYGPAYSGETFLGNDIYTMDSKVKKTTGFGKTKKEKAKDGFDERVVQVRRVTKVVKGGKQLHFRAIVVVGDKKGQVGVGVGKAKEVIAAVQKSAVNARRNIITVPMTKYLTFPHRSEGDFGAARVMLRPAAPGTGVIAGGAVRIVLEMAGVENALGKQLGSNNALNNARATVVAVQQMRQFSEVAQDRGIPMEERGRKRKASPSSLAAVGKGKATTDRITNDNINSYLSRGDAGLIGASNSLAALRKSIAACIESDRKGISIKEIGSLHATHSELLCCHFHSQGKLLAAAGHEVVIWDLENNDVNTGEGHAHLVTDIRFKPNSTVFATSSFDRTVMIWDAAKPSNPFQKLVGHADHVMSIDFHPSKVGLLSSCDSNDEIRLWDVNDGDCKLIFKGGSSQVRFQPRFGNLLACSTGNIINIFDVETNSIQQQLQGHVRDVRSICWDMSGNFLASVSEDSARIWCVSGRKCLHELRSSGNKFQSCTFHPDRAQILAIGSHELLELWNPMYQSHITWPHQAHDGIISSFADSPPTGTIALVSHDRYIKIWE